MARGTHGSSSKKRTKKLLKRAKGFRAGRGNLHKMAAETVNRALYFSYRDRRAKKRNFRNLWIARINAAARSHGITYSRFMEGLKKAGITLNRKVLAEIAAHDATGFGRIIQAVRAKVKA